MSDTLHGWELLDIDGIVEGDVGMFAVARGIGSGSSDIACYGIEAADLESRHLANVATLRKLFRSDLAGIDSMRGDEIYRSRLSTTSWWGLRMRATAPNMITHLRHAAWGTEFEVKQWQRKRRRTPLETLDFGLPLDAVTTSGSSGV